MQRGNFEEEGRPAVNSRPLLSLYRVSAVSCAKTAEPIKMSFGMWTFVGQRKHVLGRWGAH